MNRSFCEGSPSPRPSPPGRGRSDSTNMVGRLFLSFRCVTSSETCHSEYNSVSFRFRSGDNSPSLGEENSPKHSHLESLNRDRSPGLQTRRVGGQSQVRAGSETGAPVHGEPPSPKSGAPWDQAPERGVHAASWSNCRRAVKRHECRAPWPVHGEGRGEGGPSTNLAYQVVFE